MKTDNMFHDSCRHYHICRCPYWQDQAFFEIAMLAGVVLLISLWKYIVIAIVSIFVIVISSVLLYLHLKKQLKAEKAVVIMKEDVACGVEAKINVSYDSQVVPLIFNIPPNVKDGQKFVAKNILFKKKNGKTVKKNLHFCVQIA